MTAAPETVLADYRTGLDAELAVLADIEALATRQRTLPHPIDPDLLAALAHERERQLAALAALEARVLPLRQHIAASLSRFRTMPGFAGVADRHQRASDAIARIARLDDESLAILRRDDADRRVAAHSLETGEATLAAYRKVIDQAPDPAGFFAERG